MYQPTNFMKKAVEEGNVDRVRGALLLTSGITLHKNGWSIFEKLVRLHILKKTCGPATNHPSLFLEEETNRDRQGR